MKKIFLSLFIFLPTLCIMAQDIPTNKESGEYEYSGIIVIPGATNDKLYNEARTWLLVNLTSDDNMVQLTDPEKKMLLGSGYLSLDPRPEMANCSVNFKVILEFKDGKCRYIVTNLWHKYYQAGMAEIRSSLKIIRTNNWDGVPVKPAIQEKIRAEINTKVTALINNLESFLKNSGNKSTDW
ncbi:MAG: DUF4468 domain-containing protein [Bacteroidales bacterium]|nr:DUF4468 domain-containing protein [Bacteroidales bacterium]